ncbi:hypothetical protein ABB37_02126 [Leptomonas pyrrhocoris]|uniref:Uncharacterized protein n=1 Tax=Leptomonas pyrrhocoris TaxID=157538 RepID=A0A0N0DYG9_LEPPY|nr:hypothetical protein ABB37_02126 [Leptomonas pyrrhocoris]KPA83982.1 hypothetical protein ABB37_02126 [Leptomonas pyrrhocoris]|eukprot:XP_015662421.1 hypothetical protein ABB37_02126 [Leptomonas pyrrhocoris]
MDTGGGRYFPFPVFSAANLAGNAASADLSLLAANHNCASLWCFEHEEPMLGGPLRYGSSWRYRLRHVVSGMYVAVCGSAVDVMLEGYDDDGEGDNASGKGATAPIPTAAPPSIAAVFANESDDSESDDGVHQINGGRSSRSASRSGRTKAGTAAAVVTPSDVDLTPRPAEIRPTSLCLIPPPRTRREREATLFCEEPMYATEAAVVVEQTCLRVKNTLTGMYLITDAGVEGSDGCPRWTGSRRVQTRWWRRTSPTGCRWRRSLWCRSAGG